MITPIKTFNKLSREGKIEVLRLERRIQKIEKLKRELNKQLWEIAG